MGPAVNPFVFAEKMSMCILFVRKHSYYDNKRKRNKSKKERKKV